MKKQIKFIYALLIIVIAGGGVVLGLQNTINKSKSELILNNNVVNISKDISSNSIVYLFENDFFKQTLYLMSIDKDDINFKLISENKKNKTQSELSGIALNKWVGLDSELDENEKGESYPVDQYVYNKAECSVYFRIESVEQKLIQIKESDECKKIIKNGNPFQSQRILKRVDYDDNSIILENKKLHSFSDPLKKDEFIVRIKGESLLEGKVIFTINDFSGMEIYRDEFPSFNLLNPGFYVDENLSLDIQNFEKEKYMINEILKFFNDDRFIKPAILNSDIFDPDYSDSINWEDIKSDNTAIGFYYLVGVANHKQIAFSKKTKKVLLYLNSDL